ncbi:hypothetical protein IKF23_00665 [Candidatus Saccharibacteria bacterium]|nr:hypothetical protein [Candidatus Saccharibacteria bacterium]
MFTFLDCKFSPKDNIATFRYQGKDNIIFTEKVKFFHSDFTEYNQDILEKALFLAFIILGTSYYKAEPTKKVKLPEEIDSARASFFSKIYQEGLSQFAFENHLNRNDLAHFEATDDSDSYTVATINAPEKTLCLVSGGKDSLLSYEKLKEKGASLEIAYISANGSYPTILDDLKKPIIIEREIDRENLKKARGLNGHVPVTLINESLALIQAILIGANHIEFGIGKEGLEPHAWIDDLPVNHQWSKTEEAQNLIKNYISNYIAKDITIGSNLENLTELEIAKEFASKCWDKYENKFSSCNVANYKQDENNKTLKWCGKCAKCANSYLLFCPFVPYEKQLKIFGHDLFKDPDLTEIFKGLLGIDGVMKPFECVASVDELRWAYEHRLPGYGQLK